MDDMIIRLLESLGVSGSACALLYRILAAQAAERKKERDYKIDAIETKLNEHIEKHDAMEKNIADEIKRLYDKLDPLADSMSRIEGYLSAITKEDIWGKTKTRR